MQKHIEWLIIGAGPAGLQLGYLLSKGNTDYLILERAKEAGSFFKTYPRHKKLLSINKVYTGCDDPNVNMRWDWNSLINDDQQVSFKDYCREYFPQRSSMVQYLNEYAKRFHLKIQYQTHVVSIDKAEKFRVTTGGGDVYTADKLFIATGTSKPYLPNIPGIFRTTDYSDLNTNTKPYEGKRVLIIGKGNAALETANHLLGTTALTHIASPTPIRMAWRSHSVAHVRAVNNEFLETCQLKSQNAVINAQISSIGFVGNKFQVEFIDDMSEGGEIIEYDEVITCTGFRFDDSIFSDSCRPELVTHDRFPKMTSHYESTNIAGLYFIGALMQMRDYKKNQSESVQGFRHNIAFLFKHLWHQQSGEVKEGVEMPADARKLAEHIIRRVNQTASLWQQTGYFADCAVYDSASQHFHYYCGNPLDFILECEQTRNQHAFVVTLEFGQKRIDQYENIFAIDRIRKDNYTCASMSTSIHPIIRHYYNGHLISEHHVVEDFDCVWNESVHLDPLVDYLYHELAQVRMEYAVKQK